MGPSNEPKQGGERFSVARLPNHWYIACRCEDLGERPLSRTILGTPLVLFRAEGGKAAALLDRCAHRNAPLSFGRRVNGRLECAYHGWQYDAEGVCRLVPALRTEAEARGRRSVPAYPAIERQGYVWVFAAAGVAPMDEPFRFPFLDDREYATVRVDCEVEATLHATLENQLDVPHTAFLHRGLFRGGGRSEITAVVRRWRDRVEAEYVGEPRPAGLIGRILAPQGGTVTHFDRFILPSISQVEYRLGRSHLVISNVLTPVEDFVTRFAAVASFRLPFASVVRSILGPFVKRILRQDAEILRRQSGLIRRFGGEEYMSTEVDLLGPHVWRLLKEAERGEPTETEAPPFEKHVQLLV